ncbi:hypothetical protein SAMN05421666_1035 [Roseovarius nanhaiticus]|uniref:Uncharacterized protein n=1 Tax=Roseovarius nanhaiticus TaxID=573024 RepID=A0A1N7FH55_9RHOB|nr:hypothetical protein [Roseovarius nanhaiticus]SEK54675.1 hypothetical protein SAMN05216208_1101 [Roseovarius nanhaiticus]SIR99614.1 hypothetical protein SAMN05421666_1035 [Roseovarius nanhaiticus]
MIKTGAVFYKGQEVTVGRDGPKVLVIAAEGDWVKCWDTQAAKDCRRLAKIAMQLEPPRPSAALEVSK